MIFDNAPDKIADYLATLEERAAPFSLYIEGPVDMGNRPDQIKVLGAIRDALRVRGSQVKIVADEWCNTYSDIVEFVDAGCCHMVQIKTPDLGSIHNTIEAVLYCHSRDVEAYQGGTCNETDISARACLHIAQATRPQRLLVKPGMGFDEASPSPSTKCAATYQFSRQGRYRDVTVAFRALAPLRRDAQRVFPRSL